MIRRALPRAVLVLAGVLLVASLLGYCLIRRSGQEARLHTYDPTGGPLAVDGISIGMTGREAARVTGQRLRHVGGVFYRVPGYHRLGTLMTLDVPETEGSVDDANVVGISGTVLTQDGRLLLDFRSVRRNHPSRRRDVLAALGRANWDVDNGNWNYRLRGTVLTIFVTEDTPSYPAENYHLIELSQGDDDPRPARPDPEGAVEP